MDILERKEKIPKYPQKINLSPLSFNLFDKETRARGMIAHPGKVPSAFSSNRFDRTRIFLIDESGSPDFKTLDNIFQVGLLYGNELFLMTQLYNEVDKLREKWADRKGNKAFFHHSKDSINRREKFEKFCLRIENISFFNFKVNKKKFSDNSNYNFKKAHLYFSILLSAMRFIHYSHGNILIIASDRPKTFSDDLIYELQRKIRIQALIDMITRPEVGCCLPILKFKRKRAKDFPLLDVCDYLISILSKGDWTRWINSYGGCNIFEFARDFEDWDVFVTFYSKESPFEEGQILSFLKRPIIEPRLVSPITDRLSNIKGLSKDIETLIREIKFSSDTKHLQNYILLLTSLIGHELDNKFAILPLTKQEYLCIKIIGSSIKLYKDYGISLGMDVVKEKYKELATLNWR